MRGWGSTARSGSNPAAYAPSQSGHPALYRSFRRIYATAMPVQVIHLDSPEQLVDRAARSLEAEIFRVTSAKGSCSLGLAGGSTPLPVYQQLAMSDRIDWSLVTVLPIDERFVPPEHPDSNQGTIMTALGAARTQPNTLFADTTLQLDECLLQWRMQLRPFLQRSGLDVVVLGMGTDGHTASLFPPLPADAFSELLVIPTTTDTHAVSQRLSMTLPILQSARFRLLLLSGADKVRTWEEMMHSDRSLHRWPMQGLLDERTTVMIAA